MRLDFRKRPSRRNLGGLILLILPFLAGCGTAPPVKLAEDLLAKQTLRAIKGRKPYKVAVLPIHFSPSDQPKGLAEGFREKAGAFRHELISFLKMADIFDEVLPCDDPSETDCHLSLKVSFSELTIEHMGKNARFLAALPLAILCSPIPASFIAADDFSAVLKGRFEISEIETGRILWQEKFAAPASLSLDRFQCGLSPWELIFSFPPLTGYVRKDVEEVIFPHLSRMGALCIAKRLAWYTPPREVDVIITIANPLGWPDLKYAEKDARVIDNFLSQQAKSPLRFSFTGKKATPKALMSLLRDLAKRGNIRIRDLFVFYAGYGTLMVESRKRPARLKKSPGSPEGPLWLPAIFLFDENAELRSGVPVPVETIARVMSDIPCSNPVLIVDAGFGIGEGRCNQADVFEIEPRLAADESSLPPMILACSPKGTTFESDEFRHGILTHFLIECSNRVTDMDGDGRITLAELSSFVPWEVNRWSRLRGKKPVEPLFRGNGILFRFPAPAGQEKNLAGERGRGKKGRPPVKKASSGGRRKKTGH